MEFPKRRGNLQCRTGWCLLGLALWAGSATAQGEAAAPAAATAAAPAATPTAAQNLDGPDALVLTPGGFAQLIVKRNAEVASGLVGVSINLNLMSSEASLYEPVAFSTLSHQRNYRLNTVEEQIVNSSLPILDENVDSLDLGVKTLLSTGGNVKLDYQVERRASNVIDFQSLGVFNTEYTGYLGVTFEQPLGRNAGRDVTETQRRTAEFDYLISKEKFKQQVFKSLTNAMDAYWQLYKLQRVEALRKDSLEQARQLLESTRQRIAAGRTAPSSLLEVQSLVMAREIDAARARQATLDMSGSVMNLLSLNRASERKLSLVPESEIAEAFVGRTARQSIVEEDLVNRWPAFQAANLERQQVRVKSDYYRNQGKPLVGLVVNYQSTAFAYQHQDISPQISQSSYPVWSVGLSMEEPMHGNQKEEYLYRAQEGRVTQLDIEMDAIRVSHHNDFVSSEEQLNTSRDIVRQCHSEVDARQQLFDSESERFRMGGVPFASLTQKWSDLIESKVRCVDNESHLEYTKFLYLYFRDVALEAYNIRLEN